MTPKQLIKNNAVSLLALPIGPNSTSITVMKGTGQLFPSPQANEFFSITLEDQAALNQEIIHVTSRNGDVFTITRGEENTTPLSWSASSDNDTLVDHRLTADTLVRLSNNYQNSTYPSLTSFPEALDFIFTRLNGEAKHDVDVIISTQGNQTILTTPDQFRVNSTAVYVGGLRQKRNVDYIESSQTEIRLNFILSQTEMDEGQNLVVDYITT